MLKNCTRGGIGITVVEWVAELLHQIGFARTPTRDATFVEKAVQEEGGELALVLAAVQVTFTEQRLAVVLAYKVGQESKLPDQRCRDGFT